MIWPSLPMICTCQEPCWGLWSILPGRDASGDFLSPFWWSFSLIAGGSVPLGYSFLLVPSFYDLDCIFHVNASTFQITIKLLTSCFCNSTFHRFCKKLFPLPCLQSVLVQQPIAELSDTVPIQLCSWTVLLPCCPLLLPASVRAFLLLLRVHVVTLCPAQSPLSI